MFNLFEQPLTLLAAAGITLLVLLIFRTVFPDKRHWWQFALPIILAASAFGVDFLIQTDREKIRMVINTALKAVEKENPDTIDQIISDNYSDSYHNTKQALMHYCRTWLAQPLIKKNYKTILQMDISPRQAVVTLTVRTVFEQQSVAARNYKQIIVTKARLDFEKQHDKWYIHRVEILELDHRPVRWREIKSPNW